MLHSVLGIRAVGGQVMELTRFSALECIGCLPGPVVSCGTAVCCIVQVEVLVEVTEVMDELQRLLGGSAIGLKYGWHEDKAIGVALTELLLSMLQVVTTQSLVLGCVPGVGGGLAHPWLVAVATRVGDGDI